MVSEYSSQEQPVVSDDKGVAQIILWSLVLFLASSVGLGLLVWLGTDQDLLPLCGLLILAGLSGLGMALLTPVFANSENMVGAVVLTVVYVVFAVVVGLFVYAVSAWALYSNGCCQ